ncbi:MAG: hypothetical protein J7M29_07495, partial [Verrucomicrobia bacterium]|nr:hypothetical protein [Verrucomicrobiota bacterium]
MKRLLGIWLGALVLIGVQGLAAGPDDMYLDIYNLIIQGDTLKANDEGLAAQEKYRQAFEMLKQLQAQYPYWNPSVVQYRLKYLKERLGPTAQLPPPPEKTAPARPSQPAQPQPLPTPPSSPPASPQPAQPAPG